MGDAPKIEQQHESSRFDKIEEKYIKPIFAKEKSKKMTY